MKRKITVRTMTALLVVSAVAMFNTLTASGAVIGDSWDFGSDPDKDNLSGFTVSDPADRFDFETDRLSFIGITHGSDSRRSGAASIEVADLSSAPGFTITATGTPYTGSGNLDYTHWEIHALGSGPGTGYNDGNTTGIGFNGLVLRVSTHGTSGPQWSLRDNLTDTVLDDGNWTLGAGAIDFVFNSSWNGTDLLLNTTATNAGNDTQTLQATLTDFSAEGNWIGLGAYTRGPQGHYFDTFAIIPEPSTLVLLGLSGLLLLKRRRV